MEEKELTKLIDKYLDEALSVEETEEFNDLLENSRDFRDVFRARVKLHSDLAAHYEQTELTPIIPFEREKQKAQTLFTVIVTLAALVLLSFLIPKAHQPNQPVLAKIISSESLNLKSNGLPASKRSLSSGRYSFESGLLELELPHDVNIALEGPATFTLIDERKMSLENGRISAHVGEAGKGFIVETPDGNIVDLGTRFGVAVDEGGKTEAHVFQGKINVVSDSKTTELIRDEAIEIDDGKEVQRINADQARFPLPGFPLDINLINNSFEQNLSLFVGWPETSELWGGDHCEIVSPEGSLKAYDGSKMLQFVKPYAKGGNDQGQQVSQIWQLVDLRAFEDEVKRGGVSARLTAHFNALEEAAGASFSMSVNAFTGKPEDIKNYWDNKRSPLSELLGNSGVRIRVDEDETSWEVLETNLKIPVGTVFLLIEINSSSKSGELRGNYVDGINLELATEARLSVPIATWKGNAGSWHNAQNWKNNRLPDLSRETIRLTGVGEAVIDTEVNLKQPLILALNNNSEAQLRISKTGILNQSSNGELLVGYNEEGVAKLVVEGTLRTRHKAFIGRNNAQSAVILNGGNWDAENTTIRMSQYGKRGSSTQSLLEVKNGAYLKAKSLEMIYDDSVFEMVDGHVEIEYLKIAGADGTAMVNHHSGLLRVDKLKFGTVPGIYYFAGREARLALKGSWTVAKLLKIENSNWHFQGMPIHPDDLKVETQSFEDKSYSVFSLK